MPLEADATGWWDDPDLVAVRQRIERRRAREASPASSIARRDEAVAQRDAAASPKRRGVREVRGVARLAVLAPETLRPSFEQDSPSEARRRPRPRVFERLGPRPDMIAAWAVVLGIVLLIVAVLTAHG